MYDSHRRIPSPKPQHIMGRVFVYEDCTRLPSDRVDVSRSSISNNSVEATTLRVIAAPRLDDETARGLRVADKGFTNTGH